MELGLLEREVAEAISKAADEVLAGKLKSHFSLDIFQTGSGTSINMNMNEVLANRASKFLGKPIHPNDHVNLCQSSNDVIPSAIHISARIELQKLVSALKDLKKTLSNKSKEFSDVIRVGRTHLMDAVPITLVGTGGEAIIT